MAVPIILSIRRSINMSDLLLKDGDLVLNTYGDITVCDSEHDDIIQMANNNMLMRFSDNIYHSDLGNKVYNKRIKLTDNGLEKIVAECKNAILTGDMRVSDIKMMNPTKDEGASCIVDYVLILNDGNSTEVDGRAVIDAFNEAEEE